MKKYTWVDIESGVAFPCSKEYHDSMMSIWDCAKPKITGRFKPPIVVYGTGGHLDGNLFDKIFTNPTIFKPKHNE